MPINYLIGLVFQDSRTFLNEVDVISIDLCEIISIAWCLFDIDNRKTLSLDQCPVCPLNLDNFTNHQLDIIKSAPPLEDILVELESKYASLIGSLDHACIITQGHIPLRQTLHLEALKKNIPLHKLFFSFFDLQKEYMKSYSKSGKPVSNSLSRIVRNLALNSTEYVSRFDIEDAKMFSKIIQSLLDNGHVFRDPNIIHCFYQELPFPQFKYLQDDNVLKIRGMPFEATYNDISKFFSGLNICSGGILILLSHRGQKTGEALVLFEDEDNCMLAYGRNKCHMSSRYIEVLKANVRIFIDISERFILDRPKYYFESVARLRGLPYRCKEEAICEFINRKSRVFQNSSGVFIIENERSLPSGDAFVLFECEDDLENAMLLDRTNLNERYIEIFRSNIGELLQIACRQDLSSSFSNILGFSPSKCIFTSCAKTETSVLRASRHDDFCNQDDCVRLRGLPYSATVDDILDFFDRLADNILPRGIHFVYNQKGQPTGECYVQMNSHDSAHLAAESLHKRYLESRYIEVYVSSNFRIQNRSDSFDKMHDKIFHHDDKHLKVGCDGSRYRVKLRGLPFKTSKREIAIFLEGYGVDERDIIFLDEGYRRSGEAFVFFPSGERARRAIRDKHRKYIRDRYIEFFEAF